MGWPHGPIYVPVDKQANGRKQHQKKMLTGGILCGLTLASCMVLPSVRADTGGGDLRFTDNLDTMAPEKLRTSRSVEAGAGNTIVPECCPGPDGLPPRPRIVLLGETGVGKSTLGKRLFGKKPGMCASEDSMLNRTHPVFGVGHTMESHTNDTSWIAGKWLGDYTANTPCFTVIDTPGVGDSLGRDCKHGEVIAEAVKKLSPIDVFIIMFKGTNSRFTQALQDQLSFYEEMLGEDFWKHAIIEISYWRSNEDSKEERLDDREIDEGKLTHDLNMQMRKKFHLTQNIPVYFIDPMYNPTKKRYQKDPKEKETFKNETEKLWNFTQSGDPYTCKGHCKKPGFLDGQPALVTEPDVKARLKDKVMMKFNIWFGDCDGNSARSYDIFKDGVKIWTVFDEQGEEGKEMKPKTMAENENTPPNMKVFDTCSQVVGARDDCNRELSKYKNVEVVLKDVTEDGFGSYYLNNTAGRSEEVHIVKMVDGFWSPWTEWSAWDPAKQAKERTRDCTEPVNGGHPCRGQPTDECNSSMCAVPSHFTEWSQWRCQDKCYNPYKKFMTHEIRTRNCTDANPKHATQNCDTMGPTTDSSNNQCDGRSAVPACPVMASITSTVCSGYYDGSDDNVQLEFKNKFESDPPETCITNYLGKPGSEWQRGQVELWQGSKLLQSCMGARFRPIKGIYFRFHTNTWGWNPHHDQLKLCSLTVQFGGHGSPGYSLWQWNGTMYNAHYQGVFNSMSDWVSMSKIG